MKPKTAAVIVAAGKGTRMGANVDKIFIEINGSPIVLHTWRNFDQIEEIQQIILVVRDGTQDHFHRLATQYKLTKPYKLVPGGAERQDSVWNGISAVDPDTDIVAIQDAARPCTPSDVIKQTISVALEHGAAVVAQKVTDTIKLSTDGETVDRTLDRSLLWAVQTPQTFRLSIIRKAIQIAIEQGKKLTDDTAACELIGQSIHLVHCPHPNPKATTPKDIPYLQMLLN